MRFSHWIHLHKIWSKGLYLFFGGRGRHQAVNHLDVILQGEQNANKSRLKSCTHTSICFVYSFLSKKSSLKARTFLSHQSRNIKNRQTFVLNVSIILVSVYLLHNGFVCMNDEDVHIYLNTCLNDCSFHQWNALSLPNEQRISCIYCHTMFHQAKLYVSNTYPHSCTRCACTHTHTYTHDFMQLSLNFELSLSTTCSIPFKILESAQIILTCLNQKSAECAVCMNSTRYHFHLFSYLKLLCLDEILCLWIKYIMALFSILPHFIHTIDLMHMGKIFISFVSSSTYFADFYLFHIPIAHIATFNTIPPFASSASEEKNHVFTICFTWGQGRFEQIAFVPLWSILLQRQHSCPTHSPCLSLSSALWNCLTKSNVCDKW